MALNMARIKSIATCKIAILENWGYTLAALVSRLYIANIFWKSGMTKWNSYENAVFLFEYEYNLPLIPPNIAAALATFAELFFPILLVLGIGTRMGALGLFVMTLVIETLVYPGTTEHYYWMLICALLITAGPGKIAVDHLIQKKCNAA